LALPFSALLLASSACPIRSAVMPRTASSVTRSWSIVSTTGPNDEFSIGTTPNEVSPAETAVKTSARLGVS